MSENKGKNDLEFARYMPSDEEFRKRLAQRHQRGNLWRAFYYFSIGVAIAALITLFLNITNEAFGAIATVETIPPEELVEDGRPLAELSNEELAAILLEYVPGRLLVITRDNVSRVDNSVFTESTLTQVIPGGTYPEGTADLTVNEIRDMEEAEEIWAGVLAGNLPQPQIRQLVEREVVELEVVMSWSLFDAMFNWSEIEAEAAEDFPEAELVRFQSWLDMEFLLTPMSSTPADAGIRTAILGTLFTMLIVVIFVLPVGVGAAIYLEEYAQDNLFIQLSVRMDRWLGKNPGMRFLRPVQGLLANLNGLIETNVRNLAGVPSIIYGMLGLAIFVRGLFLPFTSGLIVGYNVSEPSDRRVVTTINDAVSDADLQLDEENAFVGTGEDSILTTGQSESLFNTFRRLGTPSVTNQGNVSHDRLLELIIADLAPDANNRERRDTLNTLEDSILEVLGKDIEAVEFSEVLDDVDVLPTEINDEVVALTGVSVEQVVSLASALERINSFSINGRTIMAAALTLGLLILPIIIINSQEALRAVPFAIREGSYGLGATKWQTIYKNVLPSAIPGILTGTILALSRAIGETAPVLVVGASTFLLTDPDSPFSQFTVLPIQIYNWTARPQEQFRDIAAAAIIVLLVMMLSLNAIAILLRNRYSRQL